MKNSNIKIIILFGIVILIYLYFNFLTNKIIDVNPNIIIFDMKLFYSPTLFYSNLSLYDASIKYYLIIFRVVDMFFPFAYSILLIQLLYKVKSKIYIIPIIALFSDLVENGLLAYKMFVNQAYNEIIIYFLNAVTLLKFIAIFISIILIIILVIKEKRLTYEK